jgi:hypothetical protein
MEGLQEWRVGVGIWRSMENRGPYGGLAGVGFFCSKPPNFGVEAHIEAPTGVALSKYPVVHATRSTVIVILCKHIVTVTVKSKR